MFTRQKLFLLLNLFVFLFFLSHCSEDSTPTSPGLNDLKSEVSTIVNKYYKVGAAVGIINKQHEELHLFYGTKVLHRNDKPDENTVFQIGSITKTFTATILADEIINGQLNLEDKAGQYLPSDQVTMPNFDGKEVTLKHLATHSSGIPKKLQDTNYPLPTGYNPINPYAAYTNEHIYDYLTNYCTLSFEPGTRYYYSNIGVGLLGHILGIVNGCPYREMVANKVFNTLGMNNSFVSVTDNNNDNIALGYTANFEVMRYFEANDVFQGAGFIKSSLKDMIIYLKVNMGMIETPIYEAIALTHQIRFDVGIVTYDDRPNEVYNLEIGLGWHRHRTSNGLTYFWHGGKTNGYSAYIGFNEVGLTGVVILCNSADVDIVSFGEEILKTINKY